MRHQDILSETEKMSRWELLNLVDSAVSSVIAIREALGLSKGLNEIQFIASCRVIASKAEKYDRLIKDLAVEMRDPNGTIWDEAKRLQAENKRLELEKVILRHALIQIHDGYNELGPIDPGETARIVLASTHQ